MGNKDQKFDDNNEVIIEAPIDEEKEFDRIDEQVYGNIEKVYERDYSKSSVKKEILDFLKINFSLVIAIGILMFFCKDKMDILNLGSMGVLMMFLPAFSAVSVKLFINKEEMPKKVKRFYKTFFFGTIIIGVISVGCVFLTPSLVRVTTETLAIVFTIVLSIMLMCSGKKDREMMDLVLSKNIGKVFAIIGYFLISKLILIGISSIISGENIFLNDELFSVIIFLFSVFFGLIFTWIIFWGEEYGWRGFLQPRMQYIFGKRKGTLLLGVIWGIWHLPLCIMIYAPDQPVLCIVNYIFFCTGIGIFLSYGYMKTQNLWFPVVIHALNNYIAILGTNAEGQIGSMTLSNVIIANAITFALYGVFIFAKVFKKDHQEIKIKI